MYLQEFSPQYNFKLGKVLSNVFVWYLPSRKMKILKIHIYKVCPLFKILLFYNTTQFFTPFEGQTTIKISKNKYQ